jgi:hypothetical protein
MTANSWNSSSFVFPFSFLFSSCFLGLAWVLHVRSRERDGLSGGKLDLVWIFMVCKDDSAWVLKALCCLSHFPLWWFSELFLVIFLAEFWGRFLGASCWVSRMRTMCLFGWWLCLKKHLESTSIWCSFGVARVLDLKGLNPHFPLIVGVSVRFLWGRGWPGGNSAITEVSPQSVGWIGRSGDGKLRVDPRLDFLGRAV